METRGNGLINGATKCYDIRRMSLRRSMERPACKLRPVRAPPLFLNGNPLPCQRTSSSSRMAPAKPAASPSMKFGQTFTSSTARVGLGRIRQSTRPSRLPFMIPDLGRLPPGLTSKFSGLERFITLRVWQPVWVSRQTLSTATRP